MRRIISLLLICILLSGCGRATDRTPEKETVPGVDVKTGQWIGRGGSFCLEPASYPANCEFSFTHGGERFYVMVPVNGPARILRGEREICRIDGVFIGACAEEDCFWYADEERGGDGNICVSVHQTDYDGGKMDVKKLQLPQGSYPRSFALAEYGFCLNCSDRLRLFDRTGGFLVDIPHADWAGTLLKSNDGEICFLTKNESSGGTVSKINRETAQLETLFTYSAGTICTGDHLSPFLLIQSDGIYHVNTSGETVPLVIWEECGLAPSGIIQVEEEIDGSYLILSTSAEPMRMRQADPTELKARTRLTLAAMGNVGSLSREVAAFNARSADSYVQLIDLTEGGLDQEQAITLLNTQIASGNGPDMLAFRGNSLSPFPYIRKRMLRDLEADIAAVPDLDVNDLVFARLVKNDCGGLYLLSSDFSVETRLGLRESFGDTDGWSFDTYLALARTTPSDRMVMYNLTREYFLEQSMSRYLRQAIDWQDGTCDFDNPDFVRLLQASKDMIETPEDASNMVFGTNLMADGYMVTELVLLNRVISLAQYTRRIGKPVSVIGWPTQDGSCGTDITIRPVGILTSSQHPDACLSFLKDWLLHPSEIPGYRPLLEAQLEEARHIKTDAQDEPFAVSLPSPMTEEEIQQFEKMISSIEHTTLYDETVLNIIRSEAAAFLAGQRSAEETAHLVQSRVSLNVSEQHN